jgi:putative tricarboxylic transport membrane protein
MRDKAEAMVTLLVIICGLGYFLAATQYPIGKLDSPGPGLMPRLLGIAFIFLSTSLLVTNWLGRRSGPPPSPAHKEQSLKLKTPLQVTVILIFYVAALQPFGFALSTFLAIFFTARFMGLEGWWKPVIISVGTVGLVHLLFVLLLDVPLPVGAIWGG